MQDIPNTLMAGRHSRQKYIVVAPTGRSRGRRRGDAGYRYHLCSNMFPLFSATFSRVVVAFNVLGCRNLNHGIVTHAVRSRASRHCH